MLYGYLLSGYNLLTGNNVRFPSASSGQLTSVVRTVCPNAQHGQRKNLPVPMVVVWFGTDHDNNQFCLLVDY